MTVMSLRHIAVHIRVVAVATLLGTTLPASTARAADAVTEWTILADRLGQGSANWHSLAIMHTAMHDAINAARPAYRRWAPAEPDEPRPAVGQASPEAAAAAAAAQVLVDYHPDDREAIDALYQKAIGHLAGAPGLGAGLALGQAVGAAASRQRWNDGFREVVPFQGNEGPGEWRPTPPRYQTSNTTFTTPFLFRSRADALGSPPPPLGSATYLRDVAEVRRLGRSDSHARTAAESDAAQFWAYQSSQRGFVLLAVELLDADPRGLAEHARIMAQLTVALADSAILIWTAKEYYSFWRPITVINQGGYGVVPDPAWQAFVETPPHPEYPSGHAGDCYTGAGMLVGALGSDVGPVTYVAQSALVTERPSATGMGQHEQPGGLTEVRRVFPALTAAAEDCAKSRIWAGAHFNSANEESRRLASMIVSRALDSLPRLRAGN